MANDEGIFTELDNIVKGASSQEEVKFVPQKFSDAIKRDSESLLNAVNGLIDYLNEGEVETVKMLLNSVRVQANNLYKYYDHL
jgi:hypothetical protein